MISVHGLCKSFGDNHVLRGVDLEIRKGEIVTMIGPSGAGKTTLLRAMNWLDAPDAGTITIDGATIHAEKAGKRDIRALRSKTAMVFQHYNLFHNKTALENVTESLLLVKSSPRQRRTEGVRNCWSGSVCPTRPTPIRPSSPADSSSASASPERWLLTPR